MSSLLCSTEILFDRKHIIMQQTTLIDSEPSSPLILNSTQADESDDIDKIIDPKSTGNKKKSNKIAFKPHQKFSLEEDSILRALVSAFGENSWILVAEHMPGRNSRQCRERWLNYLSPKLNRQKFTKEEDELLLSKVEEYGTKWVTISKSFFPNRTDQMVKNRYYILRRKAEKKENRRNSMKKKKSSSPVEFSSLNNNVINEIQVPVKGEKIQDFHDLGLVLGYDRDDDNSFFDITDELFDQNSYFDNHFELSSL